MPTQLVLIGGFLVAATGGLFFLYLRNRKVNVPPRFNLAGKK